MADAVRIVVPASPWPRSATMLHVPAPPSFERATLRRDGDERPLPCQLERGPEGDRLWWPAPAVAANVEQCFTAFADDRRRRAPRRVAFARTAMGWEVSVRGERWAELLLPAWGPPRLRLHFLGQSLLHAWPVGACGAWRRVGAVQATQGPVFGVLRAQYHWLDSLERAVAAVRTTWRFFDGPARRLAAELAFEVAATTGPAAAQPACALIFADPDGVVNQAGTPVGLLRQSAPVQWLFADGAAAALGVFARHDATTAERRSGSDALLLSLPLAEDRLPLGALETWRLRFVRGADRQWPRQLAAAYRDFRHRPACRIEAEAR